MSKKDEAPKLARAFIKEVDYPPYDDKPVLAAIDEALAKPDFLEGYVPEPVKPAQQEPVAFYVYKPVLPRGNLGNVSDGDLPWVYDQDPSSGFSARMLVYTTPPPCPTCEALARTVMMDQTGRDA